MTEQEFFARDIYKAAQSPSAWLISAERLRDAAEAILQHEVQFEIPYFRAHDEAVQQALAIACTGDNTAGSAEITCRAPNYPPAQVLYAYALENVLKGLVVANDPGLIDGDKLNRTLQSHDLAALAMTAAFQVYVQEEPVLAALSRLSIWAGRYPVALHQREYIGAPNSDELLDYGSRNPIMRRVFDRAIKALEGRLRKPLENRYGAVVVFRPPGT